MNTNFEYYRIFYYVSKYRNLTKAAKALHTSQPAVSRTIQNLEVELGCRLFLRSKTGMVLTPEGRILFKYIAEGCRNIFKGENLLSSMMSLENGTVYITATETAQHCFLFDAVEQFINEHPGIHIKLLNNSSSDSVRLVKNGSVDMAVISAPFETEKPLKTKVLRSYRDILIGGIKYIDLKKRTFKLSELTDLPWISLNKSTFSGKYVSRFFESHGFVFSPDIEVGTTDMILMAAKHNLGLGFIPPEFARDDLKHGNLIEIYIKEHFPEREISLIYDTEYPQSTASKSFRKFLCDFSRNYSKNVDAVSPQTGGFPPV